MKISAKNLLVKIKTEHFIFTYKIINSIKLIKIELNEKEEIQYQEMKII